MKRCNTTEFNRCTHILNLALCAGSTAFADNVSERPNILICVADDAAQFGAMGCPWVKTPNWDKVARNGIIFDNAFTCNSKSAPSRAAMITGRNSWQLKEACNHNGYFPVEFKTIQEVLIEQGYDVGYTGKGWGPGKALNPDSTTRELTGRAWNKRKCQPPTSEIAKFDYAANFNDFMNSRKPDKPFCFWYGSREPHRGYEYGSSARYGMKPDAIDSVPAYWPDNETVRTDMLDYALELQYFDEHLGRILDEVEKSGELDNTIVIVLSDNGMPFPRLKGQEYYESSHIPMAAMWGKGIRNAGRRCTEAISVIDLAPTILDIAGIKEADSGMKAITGKSFVDILNDSVNPDIDRSAVLVGKERHDVGRPDDQGYPIRGIISGDYMYIRNFEPDRWPAGNPETGYMNIDGSPTKTEILKLKRDETTDYYWSLSMGKRPAEEMYNIKDDPGCMYNIADKANLKYVKDKLSSEMVKRLTLQDDPRMRGNGEIFDKYPNVTKGRFYWNRMRNGESIPANWINPSDFESWPEPK